MSRACQSTQPPACIQRQARFTQLKPDSNDRATQHLAAGARLYLVQIRQTYEQTYEGSGQTRNEPPAAGQAPLLAGHDIVCMSFVAWHDYWGTSQHMMSRLARDNRVLFVDPAVSPLSAFTRHGGVSLVRERVQRWREGPREVTPNLYNAAPPLALPLRYSRPSNALNAGLLRAWLRREARRLGLQRPIFWNFLPSLAGVGAVLDPSLSIYHCVDDFGALPHWWNNGASIREQEARCCAEAGLVLCTAETLAHACRAFNRNVHVVPNGADLPEGEASDEPAPVDVSALPRPIIGFSGIVDFRFDAELIEDLARRRPDWSFVLVGGSAPGGGSDASPRDSSDPGLSRLTALPNIHNLGWKSRRELPAYQRAMDVCLIPFRLSRYTRGVLPLKFFEYLAAGRPVVSTELEELRRFEAPLVHLAQGPKAFHDAIAGALLEADSPRLIEKRRQAARLHSWDRRVELASSLIEDRLAQKGAGSRPAPRVAPVGEPA